MAFRMKGEPVTDYERGLNDDEMQTFDKSQQALDIAKQRKAAGFKTRDEITDERYRGDLTRRNAQDRAKQVSSDLLNKVLYGDTQEGLLNEANRDPNSPKLDSFRKNARDEQAARILKMKGAGARPPKPPVDSGAKFKEGVMTFLQSLPEETSLEEAKRGIALKYPQAHSQNDPGIQSELKRFKQGGPPGFFDTVMKGAGNKIHEFMDSRKPAEAPAADKYSAEAPDAEALPDPADYEEGTFLKDNSTGQRTHVLKDGEWQTIDQDGQ